MVYSTTRLIPLAPLFAALLQSGCTGCFGFEPENVTRNVELSPEEYAQWQMGMPPDGPTTGATSSSGSGSSTANDTDAMLTDDEICMMVCTNTYGYTDSCTIEAMNAEGNIPIKCLSTTVCEGRRHACVRSHGEHAGQDPRATWLARAAHDEAASVHAFLALADELTAHGAPPELLARIHLAADDERRHAALVGELAEQHGATVPAIVIAPTPPRDLLALAVENMVEGCVRETWAALSAAHQGKYAHTPALRELYRAIAADEARHAELAWSIHTWLIGQLGTAEQAMVTAARHAAIQQLHASLGSLADAPALQALGLPDRRTALHLLAGLDAALWSQAA